MNYCYCLLSLCLPTYFNFYALYDICYLNFQVDLFTEQLIHSLTPSSLPIPPKGREGRGGYGLRRSKVGRGRMILRYEIYFGLVIEEIIYYTLIFQFQYTLIVFYFQICFCQLC